MRDVFLAVDAGNTKTWAGLTTADGELVGLARGGVGDIYAPAGAKAAKEVVLTLVDDVLDSAGLGPADVRHAAFRLAGVDWPVDSEFWTAALRPLFDVARLGIKNDGFALIRCGRLDGHLCRTGDRRRVGRPGSGEGVGAVVVAAAPAGRGRSGESGVASGLPG